MGRIKEILPTVRAQIHVLRQEGYTQRVIAARLNISLSSVCKTLTVLQRKVTIVAGSDQVDQE